MRRESSWPVLCSEASISRGRLAAAAAAIFLLSAGCAGEPPVMSPRFQELEPARIAVMPVENGTIIDLTRVSTTGLLQSLFTKREVNIPEAVQRGLVEGLEKKGYVADWMAAAAPTYRKAVEGPLPGFDGALYCRITSWRHDPLASGGGIALSGDVELVRVADAAHAGGESLYKTSFSFRTGNRNDGSRSTADLEEEGRWAGVGAIHTLPSAARRAAPPVAEASRP